MDERNASRRNPLEAEPVYSRSENYRPDIDGLRALAIILVVAFHAAPGRIHGGFIGVDIFFVISGFLISSIILGDISKGAFSISEFYRRRIKRIFPSTLLVLFSCLLIAQIILISDEYTQLGKHVAGGAAFVSNLILWSESGYFDNNSDTKPLLHLWSLGIEEQFYIIWPALILFFRFKNVNISFVVAVLALISFAFNIFYVSKDAPSAFYTPQARFWELLIGSALASYTSAAGTHRPEMGVISGNFLSCAGGLLIAAAVLLIDKDQRFPGWLAIAPTAGAAMIIAAGANAWPNRTILSSPILVWFGLISFPLYLWHWPLLSFSRIFQSGEVSQQLRLVAVLVSILLAWLTYRLVETPIRLAAGGKCVTAVLLSLMVCAGWVGWNAYTKDDFRLHVIETPKVVNAGDIGNERFFDYLQDNFFPCTPIELRRESDIWHGIPRCFQSAPTPEKQIALVGDSHAEHLFPGLAEALPGSNLAVYGQGGIPFANDKEFEHIFSYVASDENISAVILSAHWNAKLAARYDDAAKLESDLLETVRYLAAAGKRIYVTDDVPNFSFDPHKCKYAGRLGQTNNCSQNAELTNSQLRLFRSILQSVAAKTTAVEIIPIAGLLCDETECSMARDGVLLFRDFHHLNIDGSKHIGKLIARDHPSLADQIERSVVGDRVLVRGDSRRPRR
ncbi:acyltransferase family protein [Methylosinus sp. Ce-a6]|uniref:acyltransferase family protein n=1 Tax=Methylosinus sp. Ce-a6 TaxID=2172005 RepID=UPI0013570AE3|nr:acyltransferase family protein [Methylosinus sp. Ce-a6]